MTADGLSFIEWLFPNIWQFFSDWKIPGTNMTPASWFIFFIVAGVVLTLISKLLGVSWFNNR
ncbi:MAG: hypothetical protein IKK14_05905 [Oscillospiraceae bacterium]|nr:hypothetical protein [Oscillospiraceae bacterium]